MGKCLLRPLPPGHLIPRPVKINERNLGERRREYDILTYFNVRFWCLFRGLLLPLHLIISLLKKWCLPTQKVVPTEKEEKELCKPIPLLKRL